MKRRDLLKRMKAKGFTFLRDQGPHEVYTCPCGKHRAAVPRQREVRPGVVFNINDTECVKGWLS